MQIRKIISQNKRSLIALTILGAFMVTFSSTTTYFAVQYHDVLLGSSLIVWGFIYFITVFTMALGLTPTTFVAIVSGYFLGWISIPFVVVSYIFALIIGFYLAKIIDGGRFWATFQDHKGVNAIKNNLHKHEFKVVFFSRISPVLPFAIMNILLSILSVRLKNYILGGFIGMLPRTLLSIWLGTQIMVLRQGLNTVKSDNLYTSSFIILIILSVAGLLHYGLKILRETPQ